VDLLVGPVRLLGNRQRPFGGLHARIVVRLARRLVFLDGFEQGPPLGHHALDHDVNGDNRDDDAAPVDDKARAAPEGQQLVDGVGPGLVGPKGDGKHGAHDDARRADHVAPAQLLAQPIGPKEEVRHERGGADGRHDGLRREAQRRKVTQGAQYDES